MRFLVQATLPAQTGNALVRDPSGPQRFQEVLGDLRPEAIYFGTANGQRSLFFVVTAEGGPDYARIAEALWLGLGANVTFIPVFVPDELPQVQAVVEQVASKYPA